MKYLVLANVLFALPINARAHMDDPVYEWTLVYKVRVIPDGLKETEDEAVDYRKHKKDFMEQARISICTKGFSESIASATSKSGIISFAITPAREGAVRFYGSFQLDSKTGKSCFMSELFRGKRKIDYNKEIELGSSGHISDSDKPGQLGKGKVEVFLLIVRKMDRGIPQLAKEAAQPVPSKKK